MSGHSKWSTIKHKKALTDATRGKLFSKLSKAISVALATGGGIDPETNYKLKVAIEAAKSSNMPKSNIERILSKASQDSNLDEVTYEGFGPDGIGVIVETATDNRNRTAQEIKSIFDRGGGRLAGRGAVSHNFNPKGLIVINKEKDFQEQMLKLIDLGVDDVEETKDGVEVYVETNELSRTKDKLSDSGFKVVSSEMVRKPKSLQKISDVKIAAKAIKLLENLDNNDDVQKVFSNLDIEDDVLNQVAH